MLVGRQDEERTLGALVAGARLGHSGVLVLVGEAGIGKSTLLAQVADTAHGCRVLRVTGIEAERDLPFAGLAQLLRPLIGELDRLPEPQAQALGVALALREGGDVDRFAVSAAVLTLVTRAGEERPVAILVDDAHLLDRPSADVLTFVARRLLADAVVLVATVRTGERGWVYDGLPVLDLTGLDEVAAAALAATSSSVPLSTQQTLRITELAGGNPLAIRALAGRPETLDGLTPGLPVPVPDVATATFDRIARELPVADLRVLQVAAVAGGDLAVVSRVCRAEGLVLSGLERSERAGLVAVGADRLEFVHPLARSAVYAALSATDRRRLHRRVADALPPGDRDRRAWQLSSAALGPDEDVSRELDGVGDRAAARGAFAVAASARERAARLSGDDVDRARRFLAAGEAAWYAGEDTRAIALLEEAIRHDRSPSGRARARAVTGLVAARGGSLVQARDLLTEAAVEAEAEAPDEALLLDAEVVDVCFYLLDAAGAEAAADRAERLLRTRSPGTPDDRPSAVASIAVGMARIFAGGAGADPIRRGVDALTGLGAAGPTAQSAWAVIGPLYLRESGSGRELIVQALDQRREESALGTLPHLLFHLARDDATTDRWARAEAGYGEAVALAREFGQATELGASLAGLTWLLGRQGRVEECRSTAAEATEFTTGRQLPIVTAWVGFALAELELSLGAVAEAITGFDELAELLASHGVLDPDLSPVPELVEALVRTGEAARAEEVAAPYLDRAAHKGQPWSLARSARVRGMLGSGEEVDDRFGEALAWHSVTPDRFEAARTRLAYGERLRRDRRRIDARVHLAQALADFERLGARTWSDVALRELQATGVTARRRSSGPVVDLTPRELQIGLLLADGRTTREAAAALFLSPKTVEYHLRHVYTKLEIASRAELAERLRDPDR